MDDELRRLEIPAAAELAGGPAEGSASGFTCPDCGGALWEIEDGKLVRFRCRVGHAYSSDSLFTGQADSLETALWAALRALEERASLGRRLAERLRSRGHRSVAARYEREAVASDQRAAVVREALRGAPAEEHDELAEGG